MVPSKRPYPAENNDDGCLSLHASDDSDDGIQVIINQKNIYTEPYLQPIVCEFKEIPYDLNNAQNWVKNYDYQWCKRVKRESTNVLLLNKDTNRTTWISCEHLADVHLLQAFTCSWFTQELKDDTTKSWINNLNSKMKHNNLLQLNSFYENAIIEENEIFGLLEVAYMKKPNLNECITNVGIFGCCSKNNKIFIKYYTQFALNIQSNYKRKILGSLNDLLENPPSKIFFFARTNSPIDSFFYSQQYAWLNILSGIPIYNLTKAINVNHKKIRDHCPTNDHKANESCLHCNIQGTLENIGLDNKTFEIYQIPNLLKLTNTYSEPTPIYTKYCGEHIHIIHSNHLPEAVNFKIEKKKKKKKIH